MKRFLALAGVLFLCGCPDSPQSNDDAGTDAGGNPGVLGACVEKPFELSRPPSGSLPCELIPPPLKLGAGNLAAASKLSTKH